MSDQQEGEDSTTKGPACDVCRARKVRCDRNSPCSYCVGARLQCHTTKKVVEKRQRISVSGRYDRELQGVSGRLSSLERLLEDLLKSQNDRTSSQPSTTPPTDAALSTPRDSQLAWGDLDYEGDSSFTAHSKSITQAIERGLKSSTNAESVGDVAAAVATLRSFLNEKPTANEGPVASGSTLPDVVDYPELSKLTLPPMQTVLTFLRYAKVHPLKHLNDVPNLTVQSLTTMCQRIYFPAEEFTIATFITVHIVLLNLFRELTQSELQDLFLSSVERDRIVAICLKNAETAIRSLRLYMPPTYENIEALSMASTFAMDLSQVSLGWTLITAAVRMAQDAGYHRLPPYSVAPDNTMKRRLFWFLYCVERSIALNLGRSSSIRDHDIQTERCSIPDEVPGTIWDCMFNGWADFAKIQGEIFDQLYCAQAQRTPSHVKAELARGLATRLMETRQLFMFDRDQYDKETFGTFLQEGLMSITIVHHSTLCLVYRMIPATPKSANEPVHPLKFCDEAIDSARQALVTHNKAWNILQNRSKDEWRTFVHWTLLWCPFIPYIVLIGNIIADRNAEDFKLLEKCVETLHTAAQLSPNVSKLYRACRIYHQIAKLYLSQKVEIRSLSGGQLAVPGPFINVPPSDSQQSSHQQAEDDIDLPDVPLSQVDWNGILDDWDFGLGAENAREMSAYFEQHLNGESLRSDYTLPGSML